VLLIDLDPHASLSRAFGVPVDPPPAGVLELFGAPPADLASLCHASSIHGLDYVCAQSALATLERRSANQPGLGLAPQNTGASPGPARLHPAGLCADPRPADDQRAGRSPTA
jgi:chromosome partitioning protein